jgi:hypothetical protein
VARTLYCCALEAVQRLAGGRAWPGRRMFTGNIDGESPALTGGAFSLALTGSPPWRTEAAARGPRRS